MADFSISDMPWLGQPADPAGSLARGIQAGAMIAQTRNQRDALALRRMEFEEAQRERAALLPLELTVKGQEAQMKALLIEKTLKDRQQEIRNTQDLMALEDNFSKSFSETGDPVGTMRMLSIEALNKNPFLGTDPRFKALSDQLGSLAEETERMMRAEAYRDYYTGRNDRASEELRLKQEHENRMERQFQFRKEDILNRIPQHRQTEFRTKAEIIKNDINLIGNTEEKIKRLNDLVREFEATTPGAATMPATKAPIPGQPGQTFERDGFKFTPIR